MGRIKKRSIFLFFFLFLAWTYGGRIVETLTDSYWYQEIGFSSFFTKALMTRTILGISGGFLVWAFSFLNLMISEKVSRRPLIVLDPASGVTSPLPVPGLSNWKPLFSLILQGLILLAAALAGEWSADHWLTWLKFFHGVPFGLPDPIFHRDIGFYLFSVPFYQFLQNLAFLALISAGGAVTVSYILNYRIYLTERGLSMGDDSRLHIRILLGMLFLVLSGNIALRMFGLLQSERALAPGAGFADIRVLLPGLKILMAVSIACALFYFLPQEHVRMKRSSTIREFMKGWFLLLPPLVLLGGALLVGAVKQSVQKFEVAPNEVTKELPYLKMAIENTRRAYGLDQIQELEFEPQKSLSPESLGRNTLTLKNIRLWDMRPLLTTYRQLQEIRTYYDFLSSDNDRYMIDGEYRQVMVSARELSPENLPSRNWINEHLTYTHGYGICMGPANSVSAEGLPEFFIKDIPPVSSCSLTVKRPEIYFGESGAGYAIVGTRYKEFDYPAGEENKTSVYAGRGGVPAGSFWRRLLFAIRFGEPKIIFSSEVGGASRILYYRSVGERLAKAAPFLRFDPDPYIVLTSEGRLVWIADGYTVSSRYPYSERTGEINYIRNSVKAVIGAYDGDISLYVSDPEDPILKTYENIFPKIFRTMEEMPEDLKSHVRYPQSLLSLQARIYASYHMSDPRVFYDKEDLWILPKRLSGETMEPFYTIMKLSGVGEREEFLLNLPFTPARKENMIAWMAARCDSPHYGSLVVYNFPKQEQVYGPQQIESRIDQDAEISKLLTLWDQGGSRVIRGNMLIVPVEQSLVYIQPIYLEATGVGMPELKRVVVACGDSIAMEENLESSLLKIFGTSPGLPVPVSAGAVKEKSSDLRSLARLARKTYDKAQTDLRNGNWAGYGEAMKSLGKILSDLSSFK